MIEVVAQADWRNPEDEWVETLEEASFHLPDEAHQLGEWIAKMFSGGNTKKGGHSTLNLSIRLY